MSVVSSMTSVTRPKQGQQIKPVEGAFVGGPTVAAPPPRDDLTKRLERIEKEISIEQREHERTRAELFRTAREVELLRTVLEKRAGPPPEKRNERPDVTEEKKNECLTAEAPTKRRAKDDETSQSSSATVLSTSTLYAV